MKKVISHITALLFISLSVTAKDITSACAMTPSAITAGETLNYEAFFQWGALYIDGADIKTTVTHSSHRGIESYKIYATAQTIKTAKTFYQLKDTFSVEVDARTMEPLYFFEHDVERKWECYYHYNFFPLPDGMRVDACKNIVSKGETYNHAATYKECCPMDVLTLLYRIRCFDIESLKTGDKIWFDNYMFGNDNLPACITYIKTEKIKLRRGAEVEAMKFQFSTAVDGTLFSKKNPVYIWIETAPAHRIVHAESKLTIGYVKMDLKITEYENH